MITRYYYSIEDLLALATSSDPQGPVINFGMYELLNKLLNNAVLETDDEYTTTLLSHYIWLRYYKCAFIHVDVEHPQWQEPTEPTLAEIQKVYESKVAQMYSCTLSTYDRYQPVLVYYKSMQGKLMDAIKTSNTSRFNDTPETTGDYTSVEHTTNISIAETSNEGSTAMSRLHEVQKRYRNVMEDWSKEFEKFFEF